MTDAVDPHVADVTPPVGASQIELPTDPASAAQHMYALKADPKFMERVAAKDAAAFEQYNRLWRVAHGMTPERQMPVNTQDVLTQHSERGVAEAEQRMEL